MTETVNGSAGNSVGEWFYNLGGNRQGPVTADQMKDLLSTGAIHDETLVWRQGQTDWVPLRETAIRPFAEPPTLPPPVPAGPVNEVLVRIVAISPIPFAFINAFVAGIALASGDNSGFLPLLALVLEGIAVIALCLTDRSHLRQAGHASTWLTVFAVICAPVYLFLRASHLRQTPSYGFVWIGTFLFTLLLPAL